MVCSSSQCYFHRCTPPPSHVMTLPSPCESSHTVYFQSSDTPSSACCCGLSLLQCSWHLPFLLHRALSAALCLTHFPGLRVSSERPFFFFLSSQMKLGQPLLIFYYPYYNLHLYISVYLIFPYKGIRSPKGRMVTISFTGIQYTQCLALCRYLINITE